MKTASAGETAVDGECCVDCQSGPLSSGRLDGEWSDGWSVVADGLCIGCCLELDRVRWARSATGGGRASRGEDV